MPPVEFEPTISAGERPQTYTLDSAATEIGDIQTILYIYIYLSASLYFVFSVFCIGTQRCKYRGDTQKMGPCGGYSTVIIMK